MLLREACCVLSLLVCTNFVSLGACWDIEFHHMGVPWKCNADIWVSAAIGSTSFRTTEPEDPLKGVTAWSTVWDGLGIFELQVAQHPEARTSKACLFGV